MNVLEIMAMSWAVVALLVFGVQAQSFHKSKKTDTWKVKPHSDKNSSSKVNANFHF